jgi:exodeoxyribonuclease VII small subunit
MFPYFSPFLFLFAIAMRKINKDEKEGEGGKYFLTLQIYNIRMRVLLLIFINMENIENLSFEDAMTELDDVLSKLEGMKSPSEESEKLFEKANLLKEYCDNLLKEEKKEIIKIAKSYNIPLTDIGFTEEDNVLVEEESSDDVDDEETKR